VAALGLTAACASQTGAPAFDVLHQLPPPAPQTIRGHSVAPDYDRLVGWGADWFRGETFGGERTVTDVQGLMNGVVDVPCEAGPPGCTRQLRVLDVFVQALDALDGVKGNLFTGNGGPQGTGYTSDLVLRFPPGARLFGAIPVPERVHTGLDVEAGEPWPIGIVQVEAPPEDQALGYLPVPARLGAGPGSDTRVRLGLTCALCHYSLDIDGDGRADLRSARRGVLTPGSPYKPEDAWALGNQDLHFGWLLALTTNPLVAFTVLAGPVGSTHAPDAVALTRWVRDTYVRSPEAVMRQLAVSMLTQPRGSADDTPDVLHQGVQMPSIFTWRNWPYNSDGSLVNASDRNNVVWTGSIDFTGLVGLAADRANGRSGILFWEPTPAYSLLPATTYADLVTRYSPAVRWDPSLQASLVDDILGVSDGAPGLLRRDSLVLVDGASHALPAGTCDQPVAKGLCRTPASFGEDALERAGVLAVLGTRVRTPPKLAQQLGLDAIAAKYGLHAEELFTDVVSLMLDWQTPPPNLSPLLRGQWALVERGAQVFHESRCDTCHAGPFFTDNQVKRLSVQQREEAGIAAPSTAGWTFFGRDLGPAIGTDPNRTYGTRTQELFLSPGFDPATGKADAAGSILRGFGGDPRVGYKTATLRNVWATPPYLHDGSVGVAWPPGAVPPDDLRARLRAAADEPRLLYGMGPVLDSFEQMQLGPASGDRAWHRPDAALSLQALLLEPERRRVVASSRTPSVHVSPGGTWDQHGLPLPERVTMESLGVSGVGHEFWVDDAPGGDRITALVAFLLALDDKPCELPGEPSHCRP
jgi:hypothetical protein